MNFMKSTLVSLLIALSPMVAKAYLSIAESGEVLPRDKYQIGLEPQFLTNRGGGFNANVFFDAPINDATSARVSLGGGEIDFNAFASVKYIPFPDVDNQPAIGIRGGVGIAREDSENWLVAQAAPLISKKFDTEIGMTVPYIAIPFNFLNTKEENYTGSNIVFGSELHYNEAPNVKFGAEVGAELNKSYSYISIFASFPFDSSKGFGH
ncbi:hypothetical protein D3C72_894230 [compost metagenome]